MRCPLNNTFQMPSAHAGEEAGQTHVLDSRREVRWTVLSNRVRMKLVIGGRRPKGNPEYWHLGGPK